MKRIGIISKRGKPEALELLKKLVPWLQERGFEVLLCREAAAHLGVAGYEPPEIPRMAELIIVLGGDGTMLSVARLTAGRDIPILGVNLGGLGFITEVNKDDLFVVIEDVLTHGAQPSPQGSQPVTNGPKPVTNGPKPVTNGSRPSDGGFDYEERMMLDADVIREGASVARYTVLNDIVINKGALARIFDMETFIEGRYVTTYNADGLIVATPTGSTAYSMSAGGPILYPTLHCIAITPICPHTLTNRPIVIQDNMTIEITIRGEALRVGDDSNIDVFLTLDGQVGFTLMQDDLIIIKKSQHKTRIIIPAGRDYFQILREKLRWGER
jgi:NAD+ kinase